MTVSMRRLLLASLHFASTFAIPAVVFPFNSQVPAAARVNQPYLFQFSASTFAPGDAEFTYSLSDQPAWLFLDSASRTLTGTPGQADSGSVIFMLTAADGTGAAHMQCTLVVATDPLPTLQGDLGEQLAESVSLSSSDPPVMTLLPNSNFAFHFLQSSFIDILQRNLYYYATLTDHTPLPAWLHFDASTLAFSGTVPQLSAFPQSFPVMLIASDVPGFAGTSATFTIKIGEKQLVFVPERRDVRFKPGEAVKIEDLGDGLYLNGEKADLRKLKSAEAKDLPDWLSFDNKTLKIEGNAPNDAKSTNGTVTVSNENGDSAVTILQFVPDGDGDDKSLFTGTIGTLEATPGEEFEYTIPTTVIGDSDVIVMLILPTEARWLQFDSSKRELKGEVPTEASSIITATLNARAPSSPEVETQIFGIDIKTKTLATSTVTSSFTASTSTTSSAPSLAAVIAEESESHNKLSGGSIAGIVVGAILATAILAAMIVSCCRKRRDKDGYMRHASPSKRAISRPIPPVGASQIAVTTELQRDVEKAESADGDRSETSERPPQIALNLPTHSARGSRWTNRFSRASLASSLGNGEDMIRADANIPEWGHDPTALQTPHDSFSVPAQLARVSRQLSDISPSKLALNRRKAKEARYQSDNSIGLGIGLGGGGITPSRAESRRKANSLGLEVTLNRSSCASSATRGTSVLSARPSKFPAPPTRSSFGGSRSRPSLLAMATDDKRKSIRLVERSDSVGDERGFEKKRESYIKRYRKSTGLGSPLWAASIGNGRGQSGQGSATDVNAPSSGHLSRVKSQLNSYSESSSVEPSRSSNRLSQRVLSRLTHNSSRPLTRSTLISNKKDDDDWDDTSSESSSSNDLPERATLASRADNKQPMSEAELAEELALPRNQRSWVLPHEASPTPPPGSRQPSTHHASTPASVSTASQKSSLKPFRAKRVPSSRSISPLAAQALRMSASAKASRGRRSWLSEPMALASSDSLSKVKGSSGLKGERPRLVQTKSGRPVSVEDVQWLSSLRAERVESGQVVAGADEGGDGRERVVTGGSGKAFI